MIVVLSVSMVFYTSCAETSQQTNNYVSIVTPETFNQLFFPGIKSTQATKEYKSIEATYNYTLSILEDNPNKSNAKFNANLIINSNIVPINVTGILSAYHLSNGTTLWHGPLKGTTTINNNDYIVNVGFTKFESNDTISASISIQSNNEKNIIDPILFSIGEDMISSEILSELRNQKSATTNDT